MVHENRNYRLGLDLGTNSVGWACVDLDANSQGERLVDWGVYVFPKSFEEDSKGVRVTTASERGQKRRARRTLRRRRYRRNVLTRLLTERGLLPADPEQRAAELTKHAVWEGDGLHEVHPYAIRARAVNARVEPYELGKAFYHMCRHRGFLSTRELMQLSLQFNFGEELHLEDDAPVEVDEQTATEEQKERSQIKRAIQGLADRMEQNGHTLGQALYAELKAGRRIRCRTGGERVVENNKRRRKKTARWIGLGEGQRFGRQMLIDEFHAIWDAQARHHPVLMDDSFKQDVFRAIFYQHPLRDQKELRGYCTFHPSHRRIRRAALMAQRSMVLQYLNTLSVLHVGTALSERASKKKRRGQEAPPMPVPIEGPTKRKLEPGEIRALFEVLQLKERSSWREAAEIIGLPEDWVFSDEPFGTGKNPKTVDGGRSRRDILGNGTSAHVAAVVPEFLTWDFERQERLIHDVIELAPAAAFRRLTTIWNLSDEQAQQLIYHEYADGLASVCRKVLAKIEPFLLAGNVYSRAMELAGYNHAVPSIAPTVSRLTPDLVPAVTNPIVRRSVAQAFKVINAVVDKYGLPERIRVEIPREVSLTNEQRQQVSKMQDENFAARKAAAKLLHDNGLGVFPANIDKVLLWEEFGRRSPYNPTVEIGLEQLVTDYDIDHIWPRSRTADDSWPNKTIASRTDNLLKGDKTPYECWGQTPRWKEIEAYCRRQKDRRLARKVDRILETDFDDANAEEGFVGRQLSDTRYISKVVMDALVRLGVPVEAGRGQLSATLRRLWGVQDLIPMSAREIEEAKKRRNLEAPGKSKKGRDDHRHHAVDALVVACTDRSLFQKLTRYHQSRTNKPKEAKIQLETPWPDFRNGVAAAVERIHVVYAPKRRVGGAIHEATARTPPSREAVDRALAAIPPERRMRIRDFVLVDNKLVRIDSAGNPLCAYDLGNNHHAVVWRSKSPDAKGNLSYEFEVVTTLEARARIREGKPLFERERPGWEARLHLCKDDFVEYAGDDKNPAGWYRVGEMSKSAKYMELTLFRVFHARKDPTLRVRLLCTGSLGRLGRRVILSPVGDVLGYEPSS